jgi:hypothetical protein
MRFLRDARVKRAVVTAASIVAGWAALGAPVKWF